jgi:hypothetical protein
VPEQEHHNLHTNQLTHFIKTIIATSSKALEKSIIIYEDKILSIFLGAFKETFKNGTHKQQQQPNSKYSVRTLLGMCNYQNLENSLLIKMLSYFRPVSTVFVFHI